MNPDSAEQYLVERISKGDGDAWRQLIDRFSGRLLAFARSRAPSLSDAEDLVQDTLVGFIQSLAHFDRTRSLETYLFTILRNKLYDQLRQRRANVVSAPSDAEDWWDRVLPVDHESPSGIAVQAEAETRQEQVLADVLRRLIDELRDRQAFQDLQVIELVFYAGRRNLDVAELLDIDQKAVAGIKFRAIQKLQRFLEEHGPSAAGCLADPSAEVTVSNVWRTHRLTCLKRSTLGVYLLDVLEEPWRDYTQFHLDVVGCPLCVANLEDIQAEQDSVSIADQEEKFFQSSIGFLRRD